MKLLWLDDLRDPNQNDWLVFSPIPRDQISEVIWAKSFTDFVLWITHNGLPDGICFDHDLGNDVAKAKVAGGMSKKQARKERRNTPTGMDCAKWLVEYCIEHKKQLPLYNIQSANPPGKANIDGLLKGFLKHQTNETNGQ